MIMIFCKLMLLHLFHLDLPSKHVRTASSFKMIDANNQGSPKRASTTWSYMRLSGHDAENPCKSRRAEKYLHVGYHVLDSVPSHDNARTRPHNITANDSYQYREGSKLLNDSLSVEKSNKEISRHILVDDTHELLLCFVPKVACTNWRKIMVRV
jgi:hypothetical protein